MNVQRLIGYLQKIEDKTIEVAIVAMQGTQIMRCNGIDVAYVEDLCTHPVVEVLENDKTGSEEAIILLGGY